MSAYTQIGYVSVRFDDETVERVPIERLDIARMDAWVPWRTPQWYRNQRHFPGHYWCATTGSLIGYESWLERDRLLLADFDVSVTNIAEQPFELEMFDEDGAFKNVPDYLFMRRHKPPCISNVKPAEHCDRPRIQRQFEGVASMAERRGWTSEVWSGAPKLLVENVRFLSGFRRRSRIADTALEALVGVMDGARTLGQVEAGARAECAQEDIRPALMHLLWTQRLEIDLEVPITNESEVSQ